MNNADLIFALESIIETNGLESVLRILADTVLEKADILSGNLGFGYDSLGADPANGDDWAQAADLIRNIAESLPDSVR